MLRTYLTGQITAAGEVDRVLPNQPPDGSLPLVACYVSLLPWPTETVYLVVADGDGNNNLPYCALRRDVLDRWVVSFRRAPAFWWYHAVVAF